jgi:hypothetical protein
MPSQNICQNHASRSSQHLRVRTHSAMRTCILVILVAVAATHAMAFNDTSGWEEIQGAYYNPFFQDLGKWAVEEHNREAGDNFTWARTFAGSQQRDDKGLYYGLAIEGAVRAGDSNFRAVLVEPAAAAGKTDERRLLSFVVTM